MQPGTRKLLRFLQSWVINTLAVALAVIILRGHIHYDSNSSLLLASLLLGIFNAFLRPLLMLIALPLLIFTLGLFMLVINGLVLYLVGALLQPRFTVDSFLYAFIGAFIISLFSMVLNFLTGNNSVTYQRHRPPPRNKDDGNGPVVDI